MSSIVHFLNIFSSDAKYLSNKFCGSELLEKSNSIFELISSKYIEFYLDSLEIAAG